MTGAELRRLREQLELSAYQFAHLVGVNPRTVRGWEKGRINHGEPQAIPLMACKLFWALGEDPQVRRLLEQYPGD